LRVLPEEVSIVATDLNQPMLDQAAAKETSRAVEWRQADALQLPFPDASFDAVVCQFGVMFFPDKAKAFSEARRVLCPGGRFIFNVWDRIEENEFADTVTRALATLFPEDPPGSWRAFHMATMTWQSSLPIWHVLGLLDQRCSANSSRAVARHHRKSLRLPCVKARRCEANLKPVSLHV
jgi:SAM-dependent methyltransferase